MGFWVSKFLGSLAMPPLSLLLFAALGFVLRRRWRRLGPALIGFAFVALWALSTPLVGGRLAAAIEPAQAPGADALKGAQAIVILGGGTYFDAPEYGGDTVGTYTLERLRWGARVHRETGLPILVTGGMPLSDATSEASQMKEALTRDFLVPVKWMEDRAYNTLESARFTREILARDGISRIALVTHASHIRRAHGAFERAGFTVLDSPTGFSGKGPTTILSFLPSAGGLVQSDIFFHEIVGLGWYHVRGMLQNEN